MRFNPLVIELFCHLLSKLVSFQKDAGH